MSLLILLLTSIDLLYNPDISTWVFLSDLQIVELIDLYTPENIIWDMDDPTYNARMNIIVNRQEIRIAATLIITCILLCYK